MQSNGRFARFGYFRKACSYKRIKYHRKDQLDVYGSSDLDDSCEQFRSKYRFRENTVCWLTNKLEDQLAPLALCNNALKTRQRICCCLRFYATGTFQKEVADGEGVSQATMQRCIHDVTDVLCKLSNQSIKFSVAESVMKRVSRGFYGFSGSK